MIMIPDITYLILNYNSDREKIAQEVLHATIDSFYSRKSPKLSCEVFLLDHGTVPTHREWIVTQKTYGYSAILLERNIGISGAINFLARKSKSPVVGLITSDIIIASGMDEGLYSKVQIPEVYQVTPLTDKSDLDYQVWRPSVPYGSDNVDLSDFSKKVGSAIRWFGSRDSRKYLSCVGAELTVMFWRRSVFREVGFFDEKWKACYENIDFGLRCFLKGGCTAISRDSFVWHYHKVTEKNGSRERVYRVKNWQERIKREWENKRPGLDTYFDIYKPLKDKSINDYPRLYEAFKENIYLPYEQPEHVFHAVK